MQTISDELVLSQVSSYKLYPIKFNSLLLCNFIKQVKIYPQKFFNDQNLDSFLKSKNNERFQISSEILEHNCLYLLKDDSLPKDNIQGLMLIQHIQRKPSQSHVEWLNLTWIFKKEQTLPFFFFISSESFKEGLSQMFTSFGNQVGYAFLSIPEEDEIKTILPQLKEITDLRYFHYPYDKKIPVSSTKKISYQGNFGFFFQNTQFNPLNSPADLQSKWNNAQEIYSHLKNKYNPYSGNLANKWEQLLVRKKFIDTNLSEIYMKIQPFKEIFQEFTYSSKFFAKLFNAMEKSKIQFSFGEVPSGQVDRLIEDNLDDLSICMIESFPSQGSLYNEWVLESGELVNNALSLELIRSLAGKLFGILAIELDCHQKICLGYINAFYKKDPSRYSRQLYAGIVIPESFRGFSLGKVFTMVGMNNILNRCDIFYEDATTFNVGTKTMISPLNFHDFGILKNALYAYNPQLKKISALSIDRKYFITPQFQKKLKKIEKN